MSTRKLQQEFDKLQKKVAEGLQQFDDIHDKIALTENTNQKDKLEGDLRKEIKKLQRSRDQVKQWLGDSSNKLDRNVLQDIRSRIENAMERFKEMEKVSKMKQFSNEGLELQAKLGARGLDEAKKLEATRYITDVLEELKRQNELLSADLAQYSHKKKLGGIQQAIDDLTEKIERNNFHVGRLELVLRNLDNDQLEPERIDEIRDDLDYYVENNQAADFVEFNEFYDVLELDESLELSQSFTVDDSPRKETPLPSEPKEKTVKVSDKEATKVKETKAEPKEPKVELKQPKPEATRVEVKEARSESRSGAVNEAKESKPEAKETKVEAREVRDTPTRAPPPGLAASPRKKAVALASPLPVLNNENKTFWDTAGRPAQLAQHRLHSPLPFSAISLQLETSLLNCPDSFDLERPRHYNPTNVHPSSVDYPQEPMYELHSAGVMRKFDTDTLFFCFYYSEGQDNLAKWNAARELSRRGWVFHRETKQWFSQEQGKARKDEGYKYFDYQSSWLIRRKDQVEFGADARQTF